MMKRILLADDSDSIRELAEISLSVLGDYEVVAVRDGQAAKKALEEQSFDVLVTDLDMPLLTGEDLLRWVRGESGKKDLPVIILTAATESKRKDELLAAGADGYLVKPFQPGQLEDAVHKVIGT
jgi:two-component system chemotaxis response regulator CheY